MLQTLRLKNFRNFKNFSLSLSGKVNVITGPNGVGKTNLLEAIFLLAKGKSFRTTSNGYLIGVPSGNSPSTGIAFIEGLVRGDNELETTLGMSLSNGSKKYLVNGKDSSYQDFRPRFHAVIFSPRDLDIIIGDPSLRRAFLDELNGDGSGEYVNISTDYRHVLRQRNQLLSRGKFSAAELDYWDAQLVDLGSAIIAERKRAVDNLNQRLDAGHLFLEYFPSPRIIKEELEQVDDWTGGKVGELFRHKLKEIVEREKEIGFTLIGPQRDELKFFGLVDSSGVKRDLAVFGSRGQQRMAVVHLKRAQLELLRAKLEECPVLLLDDVFSELDEHCREILLPIFDYQQTVVTAVSLPKGIEASMSVELK